LNSDLFRQLRRLFSFLRRVFFLLILKSGFNLFDFSVDLLKILVYIFFPYFLELGILCKIISEYQVTKARRSVFLLGLNGQFFLRFVFRLRDGLFVDNDVNGMAVGTELFVGHFGVILKTGKRVGGVVLVVMVG
jgi:hypothetical protein